MVKFDYLDSLYREKVKSEIKLEELEKRKINRVLPMDGADHFLEIEALEKKHLEETISRYAASIRSYISAHS